MRDLFCTYLWQAPCPLQLLLRASLVVSPDCDPIVPPPFSLIALLLFLDDCSIVRTIYLPDTHTLCAIEASAPPPSPCLINLCLFYFTALHDFSLSLLYTVSLLCLFHYNSQHSRAHCHSSVCWLPTTICFASLFQALWCLVWFFDCSFCSRFAYSTCTHSSIHFNKSFLP